MWVLVTYDVNTEKAAGRRRLRRVAKISKGYGTRVQKSVFECTLTDVNYERMKMRLLETIRPSEDSLGFYRLRDNRTHTLEVYCIDNAQDFTVTLIVKADVSRTRTCCGRSTIVRFAPRPR